MATVNREQIEQVIREIKEGNHTTESVREALRRHIPKTAIIPDKYVDVFAKITKLAYDKQGKGYAGIIHEIDTRLETIRYTEKTIRQGGINVHDFFMHYANETDTYDSDNKICYEEKSGAGDWLRPKNAVTFEDTIREYERKRTLIRWDYTFTMETKKAGKQTYHIYIETTYKTLFAFLLTYNGSLEKTWFTPNTDKQLKSPVWKMQIISNSKKKADFLMTFDQWEKENK